MTEPTRPARRHQVVRKVVIGIGILIGTVVIALFALTVVAIVIGEQQSQDRAADVASAYRSARRGKSEAALRDELGGPSLTVAATIHGSRGRCLVYRVLLTASELVPYRFCFVAGRLVSKRRSWKDVQVANQHPAARPLAFV